jgi:hypothetical protein
MFRTGCTFVAAALLFGCSSVSKTYGGPKNGQGRIVVLWEKGYPDAFDHGYHVSLDNEPIGILKTGTSSMLIVPLAATSFL